MNIANLNLKKILRLGLYILIIGFIIIYGISRSLNYLKGPRISLSQQYDGIATTSESIDMRGIVSRINKLTINNFSVFMDEQGRFEEKIVIFKGMNYISLKGTDRFNRETKITVRILGLER